MRPESLEGMKRRDHTYQNLPPGERDRHFPTGKSIVAAEDRHDLLEYVDELHKKIEQLEHQTGGGPIQGREEPRADSSVQDVRDHSSKGEKSD